MKKLKLWYLILNKENKVVASFLQKDKADSYVVARPYLKISEVEC